MNKVVKLFLTICFIIFHFNITKSMNNKTNTKSVDNEALIQSICNGNLPNVKIKVEGKYDVNYKSRVGSFDGNIRNGNPPLIILIEFWRTALKNNFPKLAKSYKEIFKYLLTRNNINVDLVGSKGLSPLYMACGLYALLKSKTGIDEIAKKVKNSFILPLIRKGAKSDTIFERWTPKTANELAEMSGLIKNGETLEQVYLKKNL